MKLQKIVPLVIYDDQCYLCIKFAKLVNFFSRGKLLLVGHYSSLGEKLRMEILDSTALEMFWFIDGKIAYGGRAALVPLFKTMLSSKIRRTQRIDIQESCDVNCKNPKAVFIRSASLISNSKKIKLTNDETS